MANDSPEDDNWLIDEPATGSTEESLPPWRVLVVDDEPDIHSVTRLALANVVYKNRSVQVLSAYSAKEGMLTLRRETDIALVLLDVVMETEDAGLRLARQIREELSNALIRIVLRTGQPGQAPEREVILQYDINDYKGKTELTSQKLFTTVISSLRAYEGLVMIERSRLGLERILEASTDLYHVRSLREFASGVLNQISAILDVGADGVLCLLQPPSSNSPSEPVVVAATGSYASLMDATPDAAASPFWKAAQQAFREKNSRFEHPLDVLYIGTPDKREFVILVSPPWPLAELQRDLLQMFCSKIGWAFDNLHTFDEIRHAQDAFLVDVGTVFAALQAGSSQNLQPALKSLLQHLNTQSGKILDSSHIARKLEAAMQSRSD